MANLLYRDFRIVADGDIDKANGQWIPIVSISWGSNDGKRGIHFLTNLSERFESSEHAVEFGLLTAKTWVNRRLDTGFIFPPK